MKNRYAQAIEKLKEGKKFLVISHMNPEGDAIGSLLGLTLALRAEGKEAVAYLEDDLPALFEFLPGAQSIVHDLEGLGPFDVTFAVDCGQKERLGPKFNLRTDCGLLVNIDHHATNDSFGEVNVIEPDASAAGEMVYDFIKAAGVNVDKSMATNLYVAIHTDTGSFRYSSSTAGAFRKAGELVALGADPWEVSTRVYENLPYKRFILLGMVLSTLEVIDCNGIKVATLNVTSEMMNKSGASKEQSDGFVNYARAVEGVDVGLLFSESVGGPTKVSLRSKGKIDVAVLAGRFNGGGHKNAAGMTLSAGISEAKERVIAGLKEQLSKDKG